MNVQKVPFPWFGGKADAAETVWRALGDVPHYVEPFFGGGAVLFLRPHQPNRAYYSETVGDTDALLCNFWRANQLHPQETAEAASWPVSELDKHARSCYVLKWRESENVAHLAGDPFYCDPVIAGWWAWCVCCSIGAWGQGGPWWPDADGYLRPKGNRKSSEGIDGTHPCLTDNGRGVNRSQTREPGVGANRPCLTDNGHGVNRPQTREPGLTWRQHVTADYAATEGYHPITMPELRRWFDWLSARLRHVRILNTDWRHAVNGDWRRACTTGATLTLPVRQGHGPCGVFLDPPYGVDDRASLYGKQESYTVAAEVRKWCLKNGDDTRYRIVYAGYDIEGADLVKAGWREVEWFRNGFLKGGMGVVAHRDKDDDEPTHQQQRERLWLSPHCLAEDTLFTDAPSKRKGGLL